MEHEPEIGPCPFCGNTHGSAVVLHTREEGFRTFYVQCGAPRCRASGPMAWEEDGPREDITAIEKWNARGREKNLMSAQKNASAATGRDSSARRRGKIPAMDRDSERTGEDRAGR